MTTWVHIAFTIPAKPTSQKPRSQGDAATQSPSSTFTHSSHCCNWASAIPATRAISTALIQAFQDAVWCPANPNSQGEMKSTPLAARPLAIEPGVQIGGALMAVVGAA